MFPLSESRFEKINNMKPFEMKAIIIGQVHKHGGPTKPNRKY